MIERYACEGAGDTKRRGSEGSQQQTYGPLAAASRSLMSTRTWPSMKPASQAVTKSRMGSPASIKAMVTALMEHALGPAGTVSQGQVGGGPEEIEPGICNFQRLRTEREVQTVKSRRVGTQQWISMLTVYRAHRTGPSACKTSTVMSI